jgi:hypothetical protein
MGLSMSDGTVGVGIFDDLRFDVGTDANGNINQWFIDGMAGSPDFNWELVSRNIGGQSEDSSLVFDDGLLSGGETRSGPGTWTAITPEPSSLILLGAGLLGLALIGVRR